VVRLGPAGVTIGLMVLASLPILAFDYAARLDRALALGRFLTTSSAIGWLGRELVGATLRTSPPWPLWLGRVASLGGPCHQSRKEGGASPGFCRS